MGEVPLEFLLSAAEVLPCLAVLCACVVPVVLAWGNLREELTAAARRPLLGPQVWGLDALLFGVAVPGHTVQLKLFRV